MVGGRAGWRSWTPPGAKCKTVEHVSCSPAHPPSSDPHGAPNFREPQYPTHLCFRFSSLSASLSHPGTPNPPFWTSPEITTTLDNSFTLNPDSELTNPSGSTHLFRTRHEQRFSPQR